MKTTTKTRIGRAVGLGLLLTAIGIAVAGVGNSQAKRDSRAKNSVAAKLATGGLKPSLRFVENRGQWDSRAKLFGRGAGIDTWVTDNSVLFDAYKIRLEKDTRPAVQRGKSVPKSYRSGHVVRMEFVGGTTNSLAQGWGDLPGRSHYLNGSTPISNARNFEEARLRGVYTGIDTRVYFDQNKPRYDLIVGPGADPSQIQLRFSGADRVSSRSATEIRIGTTLGELSIGGLYAYQEVNGRRVSVPASFRINGSGHVGFQLGTYDRSRPLVIDPVVYSTFLGGAGSVDSANNVAVDRFNRAYVVGSADASTFPTSIGAYDETMVGGDGFVSRFLPDGSDVEYSTYVGGSTVDPTAPITLGPGDSCNDVAVDFDGNAYVVGSTTSNDFETSAGAVQGTYQTPPAAPNQTTSDYTEGFAIKIAPDGASRVWATYIGGNRYDSANGVAVGPDLSVYVIGDTQSANLPTTSALQGALKGDGDAFIAKITPDGTGYTYCSYLGGTDGGGAFNQTLSHGDDDLGISVAVDDDNNAFALVRTSRNDAPKKAGSFDTTVNNLDNLVLKFSVDGTTLEYGTFVGGNDNDYGFDLAIDGIGNAYICGATFSFNYPRTTGAFDRVYNLGLDCFVTKINRLGTALLYSSFMGFTNGGYPISIAVDDLGYAHMAGFISQSTTTGVWIPVTANADDATYNGPADPFLANGDAFLFVMNDTGTGVQYCSYWGGEKHDNANGIGLDGPRNAYIAGLTISSSDLTAPFPTTPGAFQEGMVADAIPDSLPNAFLAKIKTRIPITILSLVLNPTSVAGGQTSTGTVTISGPASNSGQLVTIENDNNSVVTTPVSITIPAGATTGDFTINTNPTLVVLAVVRITATVEGDSKSASLTVAPWLEAFTLSNTTVVGGNPVAARVDLSQPAPTGGRVVNLNSTVPTAATVPATVTVAEGTRTAVFDVTTLGVNSVQVVDLTASLFGLTITQQLSVVPAKLFAITFNPTRVSGGTSTDGIVQLDGAAPPGGVNVTLTSSDPALQVPVAPLFIPAQGKSVSFTATTSVVNVNTTVRIDANIGLDNVFTSVDVLEANLISLTVSPDSVLGGNTSVGTVGLDHPAATGGVLITLNSSDPLVASVPATVTIPSGSTFANFNIPTTVQAVTTNVTISADRDAGGVIPPLTANLEVREVTFSLTVDPDQVPGGTGSVGTIELDEVAPDGGVTITLSSDNAAAGVPSDVTVEEGETTATFNITTTSVTSDTVVNITGNFLGSTASDQLTVLSAVPVSLSLNPSSVKGGSPSTGTVTISGPAPAGNVVVTLSSNNAAATVPGTVTVLFGNTTASFGITTGGVLTDTTATITATVGATSVNANLTITATKLIEVRFLPSRVRGGTSCGLRVTLDSTAPASGATVSLSHTDPSLATIPASITVDAGTTTKTINIPTRRVSRTLATQLTATYGGDSLFAVLTVTR